MLQGSNIRTTNYAGNGIRVQGNSMATFENTWIQDWNQSDNGYPGIEAADSNATIYVGRGRWFTGGNGAGDMGGVGTIVQDQ